MSTAYAAKQIDWKTGRVLDTQSAKTFVQTGSSTQANATANTFGTASSTTSGNFSSGTYSGTTGVHGTSETQIHSMTIQETQLLIVTNEFLYVVTDTVQKGIGLNGSLARAIANRKHGCHVIVNDPVQYSQDKSTLLLMDVDGKVCKMEIVRQERPVQPVPMP
jgi:hypothetical protein